MSGDANKDLIRRMFKAQLTNDIEAYRQILADDLSWVIIQYDVDRPRTKEEMITMLQAVHANLKGRWEKEIVSMVSEGESIAVEATAMMELANGKIYNQRYHFAMRIRNGQVYQVHEYCDTLNASLAFAGLTVVPQD